jgi:cell shape-determining protein MreC
MICKHCEIESSKGEGVEVVRNEPIINESGVIGQVTEKRLYLSRFNFLKIKVFFFFQFIRCLVVYQHG